jgi:hypothetical protein
MQQDPSSEANSSASSQDIPRRLFNPQVRYRVYEILPLFPLLSQINPVHALLTSFKDLS